MNAMPKRSAMPQRSAVPLAGPKLDNRRVLAALVDVAIIGAGAAVILAAAGVLGGDGSSLGAPLVGVLLCWALYYYFACESGGGQTVGKRLTNIRVLRTDGTPPGLRETGIRTVVRVVDMQFAYAVGLIAMLATGERRARLGDLAADTMVVSTDGETRQAAPAPVLPSKVIEAEELAYALDWEEPAASGPLPLEPLPKRAVEGHAATPDDATEPDAARAQEEQPDEQPEHDEQPEPHAESEPADELVDRSSPALKELEADVAAAMEDSPDEALDDSPADTRRQ
jgi:uncharacterized RDD family membrane protein YckC